MYGTLRGALSAREAGLDVDTYSATVEGRIEGIERTIRITEISVHYDLTITQGKRTEAERALRVHPAECPPTRASRTPSRSPEPPTSRRRPRPADGTNRTLGNGRHSLLTIPCPSYRDWRRPVPDRRNWTSVPSPALTANVIARRAEGGTWQSRGRGHP
jgi:hypothetical protein